MLTGQRSAKVCSLYNDANEETHSRSLYHLSSKIFSPRNWRWCQRRGRSSNLLTKSKSKTITALSRSLLIWRQWARKYKVSENTGYYLYFWCFFYCSFMFLELPTFKKFPYKQFINLVRTTDLQWALCRVNDRFIKP